MSPTMLGSVKKWQVRRNEIPGHQVVEVEACYGPIGYGKYGWTVVYQGIPSVAQPEDLFDKKEWAEIAFREWVKITKSIYWSLPQNKEE